jgi:hypothetical protein
VISPVPCGKALGPLVLRARRGVPDGLLGATLSAAGAALTDDAHVLLIALRHLLLGVAGEEVRVGHGLRDDTIHLDEKLMVQDIVAGDAALVDVSSGVDDVDEDAATATEVEAGAVKERVHFILRGRINVDGLNVAGLDEVKVRHDGLFLRKCSRRLFRPHGSSVAGSSQERNP